MSRSCCVAEEEEAKEKADRMDQSSLTDMAVTSLDWCARSTPVTLLKSLLAAHFSPLPVTDLQQQCCLVLRNAVVSGSLGTVTSLLQHVGEEFLLHSEEQTGRSDGRTRVDKLLGLAVEQGHKYVSEVLTTCTSRVTSHKQTSQLVSLPLFLAHTQTSHFTSAILALTHTSHFMSLTLLFSHKRHISDDSHADVTCLVHL